MNCTKNLAMLLFICVGAQHSTCPAGEPKSQKKEEQRVQSEVRENASAVYKGDVETVLKHTHPKVIDMLGGRANAQKVLEKTLGQLAASGMKLEDLTFPTPPVFLKGTANEFVIVPTKSIIRAGEKRGESLNYQFGARAVGSSDWGYIEGSRVNRENVFKLFPDFPKDFEFPATYRKLIK